MTHARDQCPMTNNQWPMPMTHKNDLDDEDPMEEPWDSSAKTTPQGSNHAGPIFFETTTQALSWYFKNPMPQMNQEIPLAWRQALTLVAVNEVLDGTK